MKKNELEQKLITENVNPYSYSLDGGLPNEAFCLGENGSVWEVYYSERGSKTGLKTFQTEDEACDYFYGWITKTLKSMGLI